MKKYAALGCILIILSSFFGCGEQQTQEIDPSDVTIQPVVETADPEAAIERIYETIEIQDPQDADDEVFQRAAAGQLVAEAGDPL